MELSGIVTCIATPTIVKSKDGTKERPKQDMVICVDPASEYPDYVAFTAFGENKKDAFEGLSNGDKVTVHYNAKTRLPDDLVDVPADFRFFTSLNVWRVSKDNGGDLPSNGGGENLPF